MATVPEQLRPAISEQLDLLVRGQLPELLTWVEHYGDDGAVLVQQPDDIWTHRWTDVTAVDAGGWHVVVPLWTTAESPSDLSAEVKVSVDGHAEITDVHVL